MKRFLIAFCVIFTISVLLCSFSYYISDGPKHAGIGTTSYRVDEVVSGDGTYVVVISTSGDVAICKK